MTEPILIECSICQGDGFVVIQQCCMDDNYFDGCCHKYNPVKITCQNCSGSGLVNQDIEFNNVTF